MEKAEIIDPGFSVADAEDVSITMNDARLEVQFTDWNDKKRKILFIDAVSHRWDQLDWKRLENERYDASHVIHNSTWLREHLSQRSIEENEGYKHFRLNFNAAGTLQVLAKEITTLAEQDASDNADKPRV